jgi:hypothetical protein
LAAVQAWHVAVHAAEQQTPSAQNPLAQSLARRHACPSGSLQSEAPLQIATPEHSLSGSRPDAIVPHVPSAPVPFLAALHALQRVVQELLQQTPSTQKPLAHSAATEHVAPFGSVEQAPAPLHVMAPAHSLSGSVPMPMLPHVPSGGAPFLAALHA